MSKKISDLANAAVNNTDLFTFARPPDNFSCTRGVILTGAPGEDISLKGDGGSLDIPSSGDVALNAITSVTLNVGGTLLQIDAAGNVQLVLNGGANFTVNFASGSLFQLDNATGAIFLNVVGDNPQINYDDSAAPGNFVSTPALLADAVTHIASAVAGLLGSPIP